jgi:8-amino-7-oxononanoate synthase
VLDFTSALFLDWRHAARDLPSWSALTTGRPAALEEPPGATALAARVALRTGAQDAVLHRSALHALWDVVAVAAPPGTLVLVDGGAYAVTQVAAAGALSRGRRVAVFRHHEPEDAARLARRACGPTLVLTDGWCSSCSRPAPLAALSEAVRAVGRALVVVDDTLALGVLGSGPTRDRRFGHGGAGTAAWLGLPPPDVQVASLAKAYGAPVAVTAGPRRLIAPLRQHGTRWHSSPSTAADLAAATIATADDVGNDRRRSRLEHLVARLRAGLRRLGCGVVGLPFPLVSATAPGRSSVSDLLAGLARADVLAVVRRPRCSPGPTLSFCVTSRHTEREIDRALGVLESCLGRRAAVS